MLFRYIVAFGTQTDYVHSQGRESAKEDETHLCGLVRKCKHLYAPIHNLHMSKPFELLTCITILLCVHFDRIYVAKGLLRPQNSRLFSQLQRHRLLSQRQLPNFYLSSTCLFRGVSTSVNRIRMQTDTTVVNEFCYVSSDVNRWTPLNTAVFTKCIEPAKSPDSSTTDDDTSKYTAIPRIASSSQSAQTLLNEWIQDDINESWSTEWKSITYFDDHKSNTTNPTPLHGYLIRNAQLQSNSPKEGEKKLTAPSTYILLFPTAVGAHDLFLFYKASQIVNHPSLQHCTVMIVDLFSDSSGWLWDKTGDNDKYESIRDNLLRHHNSNDDNVHGMPCRPLLQKRIHAAFSYIYELDGNDTVVTAAALGWCFGGHCIAELARMTINVKAMITFHGVFAGLQSPGSLDETLELPQRRQSEILICHGLQDPFVPSEDLEMAL